MRKAVIATLAPHTETGRLSAAGLDVHVAGQLETSAGLNLRSLDDAVRWGSSWPGKVLWHYASKTAGH